VNRAALLALARLPAGVLKMPTVTQPSEKEQENGKEKEQEAESLSVTPRVLYDLVLKDDKAVHKIRENLLAFTRWKLSEYQKRLDAANGELSELKGQAEERKIKQGDFEDEFPEAGPLADLAGRLPTIISVLTKRIAELADRSHTALQAFRLRVLRAIADPEAPSIMSIKGVVRRSIRDTLAEWIYSLRNGWTQFKGVFYNILLLGGAGVGKTAAANVIAHVLTSVGILASEKVKIVSKADLVSGWIGKTAPLMRSFLIGSLDGVLFIDEAYALEPDPSDAGSRDHGREAITEMVNFLDKYIGLSVVIAAGYEEPMLRRFLGSNEGMSRRFPYRLKLPDYTDEDLTQLFLKFVTDKLPSPSIFTDADIAYVHALIQQLRKHAAAAFSNQAGDMLNLASVFLRRFFVGYPKPWQEMDVAERRGFLGRVFTEYATTVKSVPVRIAGGAPAFSPSVSLQWVSRRS
jgi:hypothetical protein